MQREGGTDPAALRRSEYFPISEGRLGPSPTLHQGALLLGVTPQPRPPPATAPEAFLVGVATASSNPIS